MNGMDEILLESWDKFMRKYADSPEPDPDVFVHMYRSFIESNTDMDTTPLTGARLLKRFRKMGVHTTQVWTAGVWRTCCACPTHCLTCWLNC